MKTWYLRAAIYASAAVSGAVLIFMSVVAPDAAMKNLEAWSYVLSTVAGVLGVLFLDTSK